MESHISACADRFRLSIRCLHVSAAAPQRRNVDQQCQRVVLICRSRCSSHFGQSDGSRAVGVRMTYTIQTLNSRRLAHMPGPKLIDRFSDLFIEAAVAQRNAETVLNKQLPCVKHSVVSVPYDVCTDPLRLDRSSEHLRVRERVSCPVPRVAGNFKRYFQKQPCAQRRRSLGNEGSCVLGAGHAVSSLMFLGLGCRCSGLGMVFLCQRGRTCATRQGVRKGGWSEIQPPDQVGDGTMLREVHRKGAQRGG